MAEKAKFDREAAFKSIIGAGRETGEETSEKPVSKGENKNRVQRSYFWIEILIKRYGEWRWRRKRTLRRRSMIF